jgi:hypothetical protein
MKNENSRLEKRRRRLKNEPKCEENAHGRNLKQGEAREN